MTSQAEELAIATHEESTSYTGWLPWNECTQDYKHVQVKKAERILDKLGVNARVYQISKAPDVHLWDKDGHEWEPYDPDHPQDNWTCVDDYHGTILPWKELVQLNGPLIDVPLIKTGDEISTVGKYHYLPELSVVAPNHSKVVWCKYGNLFWNEGEARTPTEMASGVAARTVLRVGGDK